MATFTGTNGNDIANATNNTLIGFAGGSVAELTDAIGDVFNGGLSADIIISGSGSDTINGQDGDDTISGEAGADQMDGGNGIDLLQFATLTASFTINLATGATGVAGEKAINFEQVTTGSGNDNIVGSAGANTIDAGAGDDTVNGAAGADEMDGGNGVDLLDLSAIAANYTLSMSTGVTGIAGETAVNFEQVITGSGNDQVGDTAQNDNIVTNGGNDTVIAGQGIDTLDGGAGTDRLDNTSFNGNYVLNMVTGATNIGTETALNFEQVLTGNGTDKIIGTAGNDSIDSGGGNDTVDGGAGIDVMNGSTGRDSLMLDVTGVVAVNFDMATGVIGAAGETALGFEIVTTGGGNDTVSGNGSNNRITSAAGNDTIDARNGNDNVVAGAGLDTVAGGAGDDQLAGNAGNDRLTGGAGLDRYTFNTALSAANNVDFITDFVGPDDTIAIDNAVFTGLAAGALANSAFRIGAAAADASDRIIYDAPSGNLYFDVDGQGGTAQVQFARVVANIAIIANDFVVI